MKKVFFSLALFITLNKINAQSNYIAGTVYTPSINTTSEKRTIENGVKALNGVSIVNADINRKWVIVYYNPTLCSFEQIKQKIYSLGQSANELKYYPPVQLYSKSKAQLKTKVKRT
jgi:copper chaperone CopZ